MWIEQAECWWLGEHLPRGKSMLMEALLDTSRVVSRLVCDSKTTPLILPVVYLAMDTMDRVMPNPKEGETQTAKEAMGELSWRSSSFSAAVLTELLALALQKEYFADLANIAQCIINQFVASGQRKLVSQCGLVVLLQITGFESFLAKKWTAEDAHCSFPA